MTQKELMFFLFVLYFINPTTCFSQERENEIFFSYSSEPVIYVSGIRDTLLMNVFFYITFEEDFSLRVNKTQILRYTIYSKDKKVVYCEYLYIDQPSPCGIDFEKISERVYQIAQGLNFFYVGEKFVPTYIWFYFLSIKIIPKK